jgi:hypothetical protein
MSIQSISSKKYCIFAWNTGLDNVEYKLLLPSSETLSAQILNAYSIPEQPRTSPNHKVYMRIPGGSNCAVYSSHRGWKIQALGTSKQRGAQAVQSSFFFAIGPSIST